MSDASRRIGILDQKNRFNTNNRTNTEYHVEHNEDVNHQDVNIYCATYQFLKFQFFCPHKKPHYVHGLDKHYHMRVDTKLGHGMCTIHRITCVRLP